MPGGHTGQCSARHACISAGKRPPLDLWPRQLLEKILPHGIRTDYTFASLTSNPFMRCSGVPAPSVVPVGHTDPPGFSMIRRCGRLVGERRAPGGLALAF